MRSVQRHIARAEAIGDDLERVTGTSLDKGVELDALAKLPEPERPLLVEPHVHGFDARLQVANVRDGIKHEFLELRALFRQPGKGLHDGFVLVVSH